MILVGALLASVVPTLLLSQLRILQPNGGETFASGDSIKVIWSGLPDTAKVTLRFTSDGGMSWQTIADGIKGRSFTWVAPPILSHSCAIQALRESGDLVNLQLLHTLQVDTGAVTYVSFSSDGKMIATTGWDMKARIWDVNTGKILRTITGYNGSVLLARFNPSGDLLTTTSIDRKIRIVDVLTGIPKYEFQQDDFVWTAAYSPDGKVVAVSNDNGTVVLIDLHSGTVVDELYIHPEAVRDLSYSKDGSLFISSSSDGSAAISDSKSGEIYHIFPHFDHRALDSLILLGPSIERDDARRSKPINSACYVPENDLLVTGGFDGWIKFWKVSTEELIDSIRGHQGEYVSYVSVSPNGDWLLTVGYDGTVKIIDLASREIIYDLSPGYGSNVVGKFSPDGNMIALSHWDSTATLWQFEVTGLDVSDSYWSIRDGN
ncbi:MAG: WD40 repeat domain-containing protein [Ignavibacteriae bacterium]|nr:WD40 repeat domain-containing protein [Ignavibacteriota bacterium]